MNQSEIEFDLTGIADAAKEFLTRTKGYHIFTFSGDLGAGKTTFIAELCRQLGVTGVVSSPTFAIIQQYTADDGRDLYHMDFYRIRSEQEAVDAGLEDCLLSGGMCFVEWPEKAPGIIPAGAVHSRILLEENSRRKLLMQLP